MKRMDRWWRRALATLVLTTAGVGIARAAVDEKDLLPVDQAFALSTSAPARDRVQLQWVIADGYYLYRHRIAVQAQDGTPLGTLQLPAGRRHTDPFFGEVETYRHQLRALLPVTAQGERVVLQVKYQGCADAGVCYPPQKRTVTVALPAAAPADDAGELAGLARALGGGAGNSRLSATPGAEALPLPPEQAFGFEAIAGDGNTLLLRFTPAKGYYLYRDKTSLRLQGAEGFALGTPRWPQGVRHRDEHFGNVVVFFDQIDVPVPVQRTRTDAAGVTVVATFQGCQTDGICYPPMTRSVQVALPAGTVTTGAGLDADARAALAASATATAKAAVLERESNATATAPLSPAAAAPPLAEDSRLAAALAGKHWALTLLGFFTAGVLLAFTPCVLPMIPILSGLIAGHGTRLGTSRAFVLSLVYVLANALVFTVAGVIAGLVGANLQAAFQAPWVLIAFATLFVALALSMFGVYELQLPMALRAAVGSATDRQRGGSLFGVAAMGALSSLIVGPCVAPPLAASVLYIGQQHDPVLGGAALFLLALGMGLPLLAFGVAAGRGMPTSGPWMTAVQRVFGFVFLGLAVWMLARILPEPVTLALWGLVLLGAAAWSFSAMGATPRVRFAARFAGMVLAVVGAAELLGALGSGHDPLQPLAGVFGRAEAHALAFKRIKSTADLDRELAAARSIGKPVLFDFYADWCVSCKEMERDTFADPAVQAALTPYVLLQADVTANDAVDQALMRRFGIIGPPATLFFRDGRETRELRLVGFEKSAPFIARTRQAAE